MSPEPRLMVIFTGVYLGCCAISDVGMPPQFYEVLPTKALVLAFLAGNLIFQYRYRIPFSGLLALAAAAGALICLALVQLHGPMTAFMFPAAVLLAYVTAHIGLCDLPPLPFFHRGDYSYGIYIFGFPIQQTVTQFLPAYYRLWWINLGIALPVTLVFAVLSWHNIEKPVLNLRKRFLRNAAVRPPRPPREWHAREYGLATLMALYGTYVAAVSSVFPITQVMHHLTMRTPVDRQPPPGI